MFNSLMTLILRKFAELYPSLYDPSIYKSKTIILNTSHKEVFSALSNAAAREDDKTFSDIALPILLDVLVMQPLVQSGRYVRLRERKNIYKNIFEACKQG
jgi:hypothetical protein